MANILITGGAGFIGSHVAKRLLERGDSVIIVDSFNNYYNPKLKEDRIKKFLGDSDKLQIIRTDISNFLKIEKVFKENEIHKVCHLAAQAGVRYSLENPFAYERSNVLGTLNILELCKDYGVQDLVYASSSSVYGANVKLPFKETDRVDAPVSLYAASKKTNEEMAYTYHKLFNLNCTGLRFFTVYGPWGRPDMALFLFTKAILNDEIIDVYNSGEMARDFTYIDDIVSGVVSALDICYPFEIINLAKGESVRLLDFIEAIEENLNKTAKKNLLPMQLGDVPATWGDISKARELLNYEPQTSIGEGVKNFVDWYREYYDV